MADIEFLLATFQKLLAQGHSLVVIEHNLDLIRCADDIIDLGPEGGGDGGRIIAQGNLETIMASEQSYTGQFLRNRWPKHSSGIWKIPVIRISDDQEVDIRISGNQGTNSDCLFLFLVA